MFVFYFKTAEHKIINISTRYHPQTVIVSCFASLEVPVGGLNQEQAMQLLWESLCSTDCTEGRTCWGGLEVEGKQEGWEHELQPGWLPQGIFANLIGHGGPAIDQRSPGEKLQGTFYEPKLQKNIVEKRKTFKMKWFPEKKVIQML